MTQEHPENAAETAEPLRVLLVDNDADISELVAAILSDEGYEVTAQRDTAHPAIAAAVGQLEPDCVLLDGADGPGFGDSWSEAAYLSARARPVPAIMFTAHTEAVAEARERATDRAIAADFAAIVPKPFTLDELLDAIATATGRSQRFDRSESAERRRTQALVEELASAGATDIRTSERREWATFVSPHDDRIYQLYWWQRRGLYIVGRYDDDARLEIVGQHFERSAAIAAAMEASPRAPT